MMLLGEKYMIKNSSNFGESDQRLLDFKDFYKFENKKCFDAVLFYSECLRYVIPSNKNHSGIALSDCKLIDVFTPKREEYNN